MSNGELLVWYVISPRSISQSGRKISGGNSYIYPYVHTK